MNENGMICDDFFIISRGALVENRELVDAIINNVAARRAWRGGEGGVGAREWEGGETQESRPHAAPGRRSRPTCRSRAPLARPSEDTRAPANRHELDLPMRERNTLNS